METIFPAPEDAKMGVSLPWQACLAFDSLIIAIDRMQIKSKVTPVSIYRCAGQYLWRPGQDNLII